MFVETCKMRNRFRRVHKPVGENVLFEFACFNDAVLGQVAETINVDCIRLSKYVLDLTHPQHLDQALGQVHALPGSDTWVSIVCTYHSPLQHFNQHLDGETYKRKLKQNRKQSIKLLRSAERFIAKV